MESKKINQLATELAPDLSDLTIIGDPTTGISKKITLSQMASLFTGTVEEYATLAAFPLVGVADTIYIAKDTNVIYRWDSTAYVVLSPNIIASLVFNDANGFDGTIALVGSVATLTITTALTSGSVPFIGASGALTQDNSNLFFDDTNNRLGIATASPTTPLDVFGSGIIGRLNATSTNNAYLGFASNGTNKWSAGNVQSDHRFRIFSEANSAELITILQTGEFGIGIANPLTKLHIDGGASALIANLDANVSVAKTLSFRSDNSNRINLEVSGTESGSNAGADFFLRAYSDAGSLLNTPLTITRATGAATFVSTIAATQMTLSTFASGRNLRLSSNPTGIEFYNTVGTVRNWQISAQFINDQSLDFTASTAAGGTTYTTPLLSLQGVTSRASITGDLLVKKSGTQLTLTVDGTTGLFFKDGTNASWKSWQIGTSVNDGNDLSFTPSTNTSGTPTFGASTVVFQGNGRVGIGILTPPTNLSVKGTAANATAATYNGIFGLETAGQTSFQMGVGSSYNGTWFQAFNQPATGGGTFPLIFNPLGGAIIIGGTTPSGSKLDVYGEGNFGTPTNGTQQALIGAGSSTNPYLTLNGGASNNSFGNSARILIMDNIAGRGWGFQTNTFNNLVVYNYVSAVWGPVGYFTVATGAYVALSDINKKKDFEDSTIGLKEVLQLKPTLYRMKSEDETTDKHLGFIAQEVKDLIPQAYNQNGQDGDDDIFIGLTEMPIIAALVKGMQEQNQTIQNLQEQINELKNK